MTTVVVSLIVALPLGIVSANIGWRVFTDHFGIRPPISLPVGQLSLFVLAAALCAVLVGLAFVPTTRRVRLVEGLAGE